MLKMRYLMQIKTRPPTFFLYVNNKRLMDHKFEKFVRNSIGKEFGFVGVPLRILLRDSRSQYASKRMSQISTSARSVLNRIRMYKYRQRNVVYRRRLAGNRWLYKGKTFNR